MERYKQFCRIDCNTRLEYMKKNEPEIHILAEDQEGTIWGIFAQYGQTKPLIFLDRDQVTALLERSTGEFSRVWKFALHNWPHKPEPAKLNLLREGTAEIRQASIEEVAMLLFQYPKAGFQK